MYPEEKLRHPTTLVHQLQPDFDSRVRIAVASILVELRLNAGLSQHEVADRAGLHRPVVSRIEHAVHTCSLDTIARYVHACDRSLRSVFRRIDQDIGLGAERRVVATPQEETTPAPPLPPAALEPARRARVFARAQGT